MKHLIKTSAILGFLCASIGLAAPAFAYENTVRFQVSPDRLWQCGNQFFATGGHQRYQFARILYGDKEIAKYDFAKQEDCSRVEETVIDLADGQDAFVTVEVNGARFDARVMGRDRNRIWTIGFFVDHANGELTQDYAPARADAAKPIEETAIPEGQHKNTIEIKVAPGRLNQCGDQFYATGGSDSYRFADISVDGVALTQFDFSKQADCTRVETVVKALPDGGKSVVSVKVGAYTMDAVLNARDWNRTWAVYFFVDQAWGEVLKDEN